MENTRLFGLVCCICIIVLIVAVIAIYIILLVKKISSDKLKKAKKLPDAVSISWDNTFMTIAKSFAEHSTCAKLHVGAVLVKDRRVISTGYNGTPSGMEHCCDRFKHIDITTPEGRELHHKFSEKNELHAECNCIAYATRSGVKIDEDCTMYVTTACCNNCAKLIVAAGIKHVVYLSDYKNQDGIEFLRKAGVRVEKL